MYHRQYTDFPGETYSIYETKEYLKVSDTT